MKSIERTDSSVSSEKNGCRVCGNKVCGINYGVPTCARCRDCFRKKKIGTKCKFDGNCILDFSSPMNCSACRYKRCLQVGMKKNAGLENKLHKNKVLSDKRMKTPKTDNLGMKRKSAKTLNQMNGNSTGRKVGSRKKGSLKAKLQSRLPDLCSSLPDVNDEDQNEELSEIPSTQSKKINTLMILKLPVRENTAESKGEDKDANEETQADSLILTKREKQTEMLAKRVNKTESICSEFESFNPHQELDYEYNEDVTSRVASFERNYPINSSSPETFEKSNYNIVYEYPACESSIKDFPFDPNSDLVIFNREETDYILSLMDEPEEPSLSNEQGTALQNDIEQNGVSLNTDIYYRHDDNLNKVCSTINDESFVSGGNTNDVQCFSSSHLEPLSNEDEVLNCVDFNNDNQENVLVDDDNGPQTDDRIIEIITSVNTNDTNAMVVDVDDLCSSHSCLSLNSLSLSDIEGDFDISHDNSYNNKEMLQGSESAHQESNECLKNSEELSTEARECNRRNSEKRIGEEMISSSLMQPVVCIKRLSDRELSKHTEKTQLRETPSESEVESVDSDSDESTENEPRRNETLAILNSFPLKNFRIPKKIDSISVSEKRKEGFVSEERTQNSAGIEDVLDLDVSDKDLELDSSITEYKSLTSSPLKLLKSNTKQGIAKLRPHLKTRKEGEILQPEKEVDDSLSVMAPDSESLGNTYDVRNTKHSSPPTDDAKTPENSQETVPHVNREVSASSQPLFSREEEEQLKWGYCFRSIKNRCSLGKLCKFSHLPLTDERISASHCFKFFQQAWSSKHYNVITNFLNAVKNKNNPKIEKMMIEIMIKNAVKHDVNFYEVLVTWKDLEQLGGNTDKLVQVCHYLHQNHKLHKILVKLKDNNEWFTFWKIIECTLEKNFNLPEKVVFAALDSLSKLPSFIPVSIELMTALPPLVLMKINVQQWAEYLKSIQEIGRPSDADFLRNMMKNYLWKFPEFRVKFSRMFFVENEFIKSFPAPPGNETELVSAIPDFARMAPDLARPTTASVQNANSSYSLQSQKNHMTFHIEENIERNYNYRQQNNKQRSRLDDNTMMIEVSEERKQLSELAACFLCSLFNNRDMKQCLDDLLLFFLSDLKKACFHFSSFLRACLTDGVVNGDLSRLKRYLSQIGVVIFLELRQGKRLKEAYDILNDFHKHNINYIELQEMSGHGNEITRTKLVIAVLDVCMKLQKYISAFNILKSSDWANQYCSEKSHKTERLQRLKLLRDLIYCLLREHHLNEAYMVLLNLFQSHADDLHILKADYLINLDVGVLCDEVILSAVSRGEIEIGVKLYQKAQDCTVTLEQVTLRTLFVTCLNCNINAFCENIFTFCCNCGIYPQQKVENWPWCIKIYSYFTHEEICYIFQNYLKRLANFLSLPENHPNISKEKQVLKINVEELTSYDNSYVKVLKVPSTLEAVVDRILTVASQRLQPPLRVIPKGNNTNRILEVTAKTLQSYLSHLGVRPLHNEVDTISSIQYLWSNFRKPQNIKNFGYFNPFHSF